MRFRSQVINTTIFSKLIASLSTLGKVCWMRLEDSIVRFTIIPDQGTQVWAQLPVEAIFQETTYTLESATGVINLEVPLSTLHRALRSAAVHPSAWVQLRLTKKGNVPLLALTVKATSWSNGSITTQPEPLSSRRGEQQTQQFEGHGLNEQEADQEEEQEERISTGARKRETTITQEIPIKVLHESAIESLHEPRCRDPDVHIILPNLSQLKMISERFTKLAMPPSQANSGGGGSITTITTADGVATGGATVSPKLELSANMHGSLRLAIATDALRISSTWSDLVNPPLDPSQMSQSEMEQLPSERMRDFAPDDERGWATVRIDGKDWARVLSVGRLNPKVVACFIHETALILYVYLPGPGGEEESCLTYYINSYLN